MCEDIYCVYEWLRKFLPKNLAYKILEEFILSGAQFKPLCISMMTWRGMGSAWLFLPKTCYVSSTPNQITNQR